MSLYFRNSYSVTLTVSVAVLKYDSGCANPWRKIGWFNVGPAGQTVKVWDGTLQTNQLSVNWYYYAYASDGEHWGGSDVSVGIAQPAAFNQCWQDNTGDNLTVGMRNLNINGYTDYILILVPASGVPVSCASGGPYAAVDLGTYDGNGTANETQDGDVTVDNISDGFTLQLESLHGSITVNQKIDQHSVAILTGCGNISIGQKIDQGSSAQITSIGGSIDIGQKVDQHSSAVLNAGTTVHIGQKIDQHSVVTIVAQGDINIDQGLDQHSNSDITSLNGSITIGQAVDGNATATLRAPNGSIAIGQKVAGGAQVKWHALSFNCPDTSGGTVTEF
jgi:hypothetical protein